MQQKKKARLLGYEFKPAILPFYVVVSQTIRRIALKCNILPTVLTHLAERVVTRLKLDYLQAVLTSHNLCRSEVTQLAGERHKAAIVVCISENAGLESLASLLVDKATYLHLTLHTSKCEKRPTVCDSYIMSNICHNC